MTAPRYWINGPTHLTWTPVFDALEGDAGVELPLLGTVSAGAPLDVTEERESVVVPRQMARKRSFALRVRGHSMVEDQIHDGDIILVEQRQTAENGETVVALIKGEQVTLKRFYREAEAIRLQPANPAMDPLSVRHSEVQILGVVAGLVRTSG
jgi:repressor LexA